MAVKLMINFTQATHLQRVRPVSASKVGLAKGGNSGLGVCVGLGTAQCRSHSCHSCCYKHRADSLAEERELVSR